MSVPLISPRRELGEFKKRYRWMAVVVVLVFAMLIVRVAQLQLVQGQQWKEKAIDNITKVTIVPALRGVIRDRNGQTLAENRASYRGYFVPQFMEDKDFTRLAQLMDLSAEELAAIRRRAAEVPKHRMNQQIMFARDLSPPQVAALESHSRDLPAVTVLATAERVYPFGSLAAHGIGYMNEVNAEDLEKDPHYRIGDRVGRTGVERGWEEALRGKAGFRKQLISRKQALQGLEPQDYEEERRAEPGYDLTLTLDMGLMRIAEHAFRGQPSGALVVVDVERGEVLALYSKPSYDLGEMSAGMSQQRYEELSTDVFRPLIDKTLYETYFPGSTFKPITALAAVGDGIVDPHDTIECHGFLKIGRRRFRCGRAHGDVNLHDALVRSCNVYFWTLSEQVGIEGINRYARAAGLGEKTGIGIAAESPGFLASREWYEKQHESRFLIGFTMNTAIGQGNTRVTLVQLASAYAAIANGGTVYRPMLVSRISTHDGKLVSATEPEVLSHLDVPDSVLGLIRRGLDGVVNDLSGTAFDARIADGVRIAGKTGTAQVVFRPAGRGQVNPTGEYLKRDHAWFAGYAPSHAPRYAIAVLVEHGGSGGRHAAPIAMQVLNRYLGPILANEGQDGREEPVHEGPTDLGVDLPVRQTADGGTSPATTSSDKADSPPQDHDAGVANKPAHSQDAGGTP